MLEGGLAVFAGDVHPVLHIVISLVGQEGLRNDGVEDDLAFDCEEGREDGRSLILLEEIHVLRTETLQEGTGVRSSDRESSPAVKLGDPAFTRIESRLRKRARYKD